MNISNGIKYNEISNKRKLLLRSLATIIDSTSILLFIFIFVFILGQSILISMLFASLVVFGFNILSLFLFNGKTLGLKMTRLEICDWYGGESTIWKKMMRVSLLTLYWIPFVNAMLVLTNIISIILYKDKMFHDFISKTKLINKDSSELEEKENE